MSSHITVFLNGEKICTICAIVFSSRLFCTNSANFFTVQNNCTMRLRRHHLYYLDTSIITSSSILELLTRPQQFHGLSPETQT